MNRKNVQLTAILMIVAAVIIGQLTRKSEADVTSQQAHRPEITSTTASMSERLGADDNPSFVVHFTGDTHGSLEDCGCTGGGYGGLMRRAAYTNAFKEKFKNVPTLLVESGGLFADDRTTHGFMRIDSVVKNDWMVKAHDAYGVDAVNLSATDWRYIARLIERNEFAAKSESQPTLKRLVSANVTSASPVFKPLPFLIKEVQLVNQSSPVRVAFIGLTETQINVPAVFKVSDPVAAAKRVVPEARRNADVIIILAHLKTNEAEQIAREVPGVNAIITSTGDIAKMFIPPMKIGETLIEFTPYETRFLGELRFYRDAQGNLTVRDRFISLDSGMKNDEEAATMVAAASEAKNGIYKEMQTLLKDWQTAASAASRSLLYKNPPPSATATYISAKACADSHTEQYVKWINTKHAATSNSLTLHSVEFETSCLQCHGTLRPSAAPLSKDNLPRFANLQCEQCHGPGSLHALKPMKGYGKITDLKTACSSCHTPQTSPNFNPQAAWLKIKH